MMRFSSMILSAAILAMGCGNVNTAGSEDLQAAIVAGSLRAANPADPQGLWIGTEVTTLLTPGGLPMCETITEIEAHPTDPACAHCELALEIDFAALALVDDCVDGSVLGEGHTLLTADDGTVWLDGKGQLIELGPGEIGPNQLAWRRVVWLRNGVIVDDVTLRR